jgi:hypothetical protein
MNTRHLVSRAAAYAWAAPNTALGIAAGLVVLCLGGRVRFVAGTAEFHAYALSSLWQLAHGRDWYRDNRFELRAYGAGDARRRRRSGPSR